MKKKPPKQAELKFKPTEHQLDLIIGKANNPEQKLQFFTSKNCQKKSKNQPSKK